MGWIYLKETYEQTQKRHEKIVQQLVPEIDPLGQECKCGSFFAPMKTLISPFSLYNRDHPENAKRLNKTLHNGGHTLRGYFQPHLIFLCFRLPASLEAPCIQLRQPAYNLFL